MTITNKLEKNIILYAMQFNQLAIDTFGDHFLNRASLNLEALSFRIKYMYKNKLDLDKIDIMKDQFCQQSAEVRKANSKVIYYLLKNILNCNDIIDVLIKDITFDSVYVKLSIIVISDNIEELEKIDNLDNDVLNIYPNNFFRIYTDSYNDAIAQAYPELFINKKVDIGVGNDNDVFVHNLTFQTTEDCSCRCTYCYEISKSDSKMDFETAKVFIDNLLNDKYGYINRYNSPAIILEFIGGEPLLEIKLTRKIYEYFLSECYRLNHPWFSLHRVSLCSNGLQYFEPEVQSFFKDYGTNISFNISIDGSKELHDSCRLQRNGEGSYDIAIAALNHYVKNYNSERNSKMTLAPSNIKYLYESVIDFINNGMKSINLNCVFEEGWNQETANIEYNELIKLADYILENDLEHIFISIFNDRQEDRSPKENDSPFCFKAGTGVLTENGNVDIKDIKIGDIIYTASGNKHVVTKINSYISNNNKTIKIRGAFPIHCTNDHKIFARKLYGKNEYGDPDFYRADQLSNNDLVALPFLDLSKNTYDNIDDSLAFCIGVFLADGHIPHKHGIPDSCVVITPGYDRTLFYYNTLKDAGLSFSSFKNRTTMVYTIYKHSSEINNKFYEICKECGHLAHNKHFPKIIFESTPRIISKCIEGYSMTDGYTVPDDSVKNRGMTKINSVSKWLMNDLMILLRSLGMMPTCYYYKRAGTMLIENRIVNVQDRFEVYYHSDLSNIQRPPYIKDDNYNVFWSQINNISNDNESYTVYCPTVMPQFNNQSEEHTIIADTVAVRQCGGGSGSMLSIRPNGDLYPCIRFMPSSIGNDETYKFGNVFTTFNGRDTDNEVLRRMDINTRRGEMNDICFNCPIGNDCAGCSAVGINYFDTPFKRATFICIQMIAEALANIYYWNLLNIKHPEYKLGVRKNNVPDEWSLLVIDKDELDKLKLIEIQNMITTIDNNLKK